jgi:hypothetical protein
MTFSPFPLAPIHEVKVRPVKGHEFGLNLSDADRKVLIAFLKTL